MNGYGMRTTDEAVVVDAPGMYKPHPIKKFIRTYLFERTMWAIPRDDSVFDLCCGWGFYFTINPNAAGVDGDADAVTYLKSRGHDVRRANVLEPLSFEMGHFDYVVAHDVLEHFVYNELLQIMQNVHAVLKPGGTFVVWVPNRKGFDFGVDIGAGHRLFVTAEVIKAVIGDRFTIVKHYAELLPRAIGEAFTHNKEVFLLRAKDLPSF
jgi:SAM-dependent methyltransferase